MPVNVNMNFKKRHQQGSVLLEALIAILIFSIGILALVGMQASAINNVADAKYRSTAGFLANQIMGTIWVFTSTVQAASSVVTNPNINFACNPCTGVNGNAYTQVWWASGVNVALPAATASIVITNYPAINPVSSMVTVTVGWQPPRATAPHRHVVSTVIN